MTFISDIAVAVWLILLFAAAVLFMGEPDLHDHIVKYWEVRAAMLPDMLLCEGTDITN